MIKKLVLMLMITVLSLSNTFAYENLNVEYVGETEKLFKTNEDFFMNIPSLLPGDIYEDKAVLFNDSDFNINLYFKTEPLEKEKYELEEDYKLLEKIKLSISVKKGKEIVNVYDGFLASKNFVDFKKIGSYIPKEKADFIFRLEVPTELKNEFDMTRTKVKWIFGVEPEEIEKEVLGDDFENQSNVNIEKQTINSHIKTGDTSNTSIYIAIGSFSFLLFLLLIKKSRKEIRKDEDENRKEE